MTVIPLWKIDLKLTNDSKIADGQLRQHASAVFLYEKP